MKESTLRYLRRTRIPFQPSDIMGGSTMLPHDFPTTFLLDATDRFAVFLDGRTSIRIFDLAEDLMRRPLRIDIPAQMRIETFKMLNSTTAAAVIQHELTFERRIVLLRCHNGEWESVDEGSVVDKQWTMKQELQLLPQRGSSNLYIVEVHHDCVPDPWMPDFSFPMQSFYRIRVPEELSSSLRVDLLDSHPCYSDSQRSYSSLTDDGKALIFVKAMFTFAPRDGSLNVIMSEYPDNPDYILQSFSLSVFILPLDREGHDPGMTFTRKVHNIPSTRNGISINGATLCGTKFHLSQPSGSLVYDIEQDNFEFIEFDDVLPRFHTVRYMSEKVTVGLCHDPKNINTMALFRARTNKSTDCLTLREIALASVVNLLRPLLRLSAEKPIFENAEGIVRLVMDNDEVDEPPEKRRR